MSARGSPSPSAGAGPLTACLLALVVLPARAAPAAAPALVLGAVDDERAELQERLTAERANFEALEADKGDLLGAIDALQRSTR